MTFEKQDYILRCIKKKSRKKWEFFIITRIVHGLNEDDIEFVTQQLVRRPDGTRALTDLYFPQFDLHIEIDEEFHDRQLDKDAKREQDIIELTGHTIKRIKISDDNKNTRDIDEIRTDVDRLISEIKDMKQKAICENRFEPWDWENRYLAGPVISKGLVSIRDNVVFKTQLEALRCFGFKGRGFQRGAWVIPDGTHDVVWFPRLYQHGMWINELTEAGQTIRECAINEDGKLSIKKQIENEAKHPGRKHIVFAKARDVLGFNLLRYVGSFRMNLGRSSDDCLIFDRISENEKVRV